MDIWSALAPAKINLGLFIGPSRPHDGRHELVTVMQSISLADELTLESAPAGVTEDEVLCPGVPGAPADNLAVAALRSFRARTGWDAPALRLHIAKRIPVAAGLGGGSADAAAALRLASRASGLGDEALLCELGADLGADVPAQVSPGCWLATGAGERLQELSGPEAALRLLVLPLAAGLSTGEVYAEADRLGLARTREALEDRREALQSAWGKADQGGPSSIAGELLHNDLQRAAVSLYPEIVGALDRVREAGARTALVSGSGPTVVGLFPGDSDARASTRGITAGPSRGDGRDEPAGPAAGLRHQVPGALWARAVDAAFARATPAAGHGPRAG
jgi:4-diphosphocytidyl-2-C-methyl-D-erythritol kinase